MEKESAKKRSWGLTLWGMWGSKHDESTMEREEKAEREVATTTATPTTTGAMPEEALKSPAGAHSRSRSRRRVVSDTGQSSTEDDHGNPINENTPAAEILRRREEEEHASHHPLATADPTPKTGKPPSTQPNPPPTNLLSTNRPTAAG